MASASRALSTSPRRTASRKARTACSTPRWRATGTQSPRRRSEGWPLWSITSARLRTTRLVSWPETSRTSSAEPLIRFITPSAVKPSPASCRTRWCTSPSTTRARTSTVSAGPGSRKRRVSATWMKSSRIMVRGRSGSPRRFFCSRISSRGCSAHWA
ncbi:lipoprotein N-acyltransferase integral membrane [Streptomyces albus]|uniref:Lipoprotein N-acyltransferase integral membrane n=1 Tax=Streptomyces albus (strain ATCC 21838 / DSM 41398 / FERM P-419 / JCM 4703 / NBRC 107858) TaxID=1081613 RepID=A0A0B5F5V9_STRA4|nr:lipoprotein N-acyltransferase integral membrane [Streptomyces albus]AOU81274.1 lipoprotein N-acyltransferase integral membrane [Streptomyces albus]AYN36966.1 lipoprotein N-acyltransferase integral membrane [Streptomyces albus]